MPDKFKKGDVVYFKGKGYPASLQFPVKGTEYEALGMVEKTVFGIITVNWHSGLEFEYTEDVLRHNHRITKFIRYLFDCVKEAASEIRTEMSTYLKYRTFKRGNTVCLKKSTGNISTCDIGIVDGKSYPCIKIEWNIGYSYTPVYEIEHCSAIDPNRSFKSYKRSRA